MWDKMQVFYFGSDLLPRPKSLIPFSKVLGESPCTRCVCVCGWGGAFHMYIYLCTEGVQLVLQGQHVVQEARLYNYPNRRFGC